MVAAVGIDDCVGALERALEQLSLPNVIRGQHADAFDTRMVRDQLGSQGLHQTEDRCRDIGYDLAEKGLADKAGQQDDVDATHFQAADHAEGVELAARRVVTRVGAQKVTREALVLECNGVALVIDRGGADEVLEEIGASQRAKAANHTEGEPIIDHPSLSFPRDSNNVGLSQGCQYGKPSHYNRLQKSSRPCEN